MSLRRPNANDVTGTYNRSRYVVPMSGPDATIFSQAATEACYGWDRKVSMRLPIVTGARGSSEIARKHWRELATEDGIVKVLAMGYPTCHGCPSGKGRADSG
jgi:hypothetical protein